MWILEAHRITGEISHWFTTWDSDFTPTRSRQAFSVPLSQYVSRTAWSWSLVVAAGC